MINIKLAELLGKHKMTRKRLAELTDTRPNTIGDLYNEKCKKIDIEVLNKICTVLECNIEDILEYKKDGDNK
ncbi:transcriptional regulator [Sporanaerobium hydrogeniformans]|uniref:Transcriptional regulator n=1 Tax=Sporanaerobium hydrogeniformans TaxID=3072179 RepID=A0AC61DDJ3_9FIRM|nr:helix-turn-helix transcriptional regulator [Sporanaerobium hydrogeniformans]PHV70687.1 transcriptional regulator [Sporanaerobium hydrogeniformans]